jgi:hypothetical protein
LTGIDKDLDNDLLDRLNVLKNLDNFNMKNGIYTAIVKEKI